MMQNEDVGCPVVFEDELDGVIRNTIDWEGIVARGRRRKMDRRGRLEKKIFTYLVQGRLRWSRSNWPHPPSHLG